jgi:hypothetical protein
MGSVPQGVDDEDFHATDKIDNRIRMALQSLK